MTYLYSCSQRQKGIAAVAHLEYSPKAILCKISYLQYFQLRRHGAEVELCDEDIIDDDGRFRGLVQSSREQVASALIKVFVGRQRRPVEVEGHRAGGLNDYMKLVIAGGMQMIPALSSAGSGVALGVVCASSMCSVGSEYRVETKQSSRRCSLAEIELMEPILERDRRY